MTQTIAAKTPAAFYRGYELGNGINDWIPRPQGTDPAIPKNTLYGNKATIQVVGSNTHWEISVDAFRFGADSTPKALHEWWRLLIENIFIKDPGLFTVKIGELVFIEDRRLRADGGDDITALLTDNPISQGATTINITGADSFLVANDVLFIHDTAEKDRKSDVFKVVSTPTSSSVTVDNIRISDTGAMADYAIGSRKAYKVEAAWRDVFMRTAPDIGPAEDSSLGHFRKSIPFTFITGSDPFPALPR